MTAVAGPAPARPRWPAVVIGGAVVGAIAVRSPLAAAAIVAGVAVLLAVRARPALGAVLLVGAVPALSGLRRGLPFPGVRPSEVAVLALAALVLARLRGPRLDRVDHAALAYAGTTLVLGLADTALRGDALTVADAQTVLGPLLFYALYRAARVGLGARRDAALALRVALLAAIPVAVTAVAQALDLGPAREWLARLTSGTDSGQFGALLELGVGRATGPFGHPHTLGAYLMVVVLLAVALLFEPDQTVLGRAWLLVVVAAAAAGLAATATAAPAAAALVGATWIGIRAGRSRRVLGWAAAITGIAVLAASPLIVARARQQYADGAGTWVPQTLRYRWDVWSAEYWPAMRGHWLTGFGPGMPDSVSYPYTESLYISLALRGGVVLLIVYCVLIAVVLAALGAAAATAAPEHRAAGTALTVATVALIPLHVIEPYWLTTGSPQLWWALLGLALAAPAGRASRPAQ